ncbi:MULTISPECIES: hypothetical protein [Corynebacterium]|nr:MULTISPECIES: hypothetical protein [Corynebacterium]QRQ65389.1 hypothetical protein I6J23_02710 [Corynebacterium kroppenstedtii]
MTFLLSLVTVADANDGVITNDGSLPDFFHQLLTIIDEEYRRLSVSG